MIAPAMIPKMVSATVCVDVKYVTLIKDQGLTTMTKEYKYVFVR